jgi:aspartate/methionine/tyrosine aminotransferase
VGDFISDRDMIPREEVKDENIYITNGASEGVSLILSMLLQHDIDGVITNVTLDPYPHSLIPSIHSRDRT